MPPGSTANGASWRRRDGGRVNVSFPGTKWTDSVSHGELLRVGHNEKLEVDPANLRFLFQGVSDRDKAGKAYGEIPWRLGILELRHDATGVIRD